MRGQPSPRRHAERGARRARGLLVAGAAWLALGVGVPAAAKDVDGVWRWFVTRNRELGRTGDEWGTTLDVRYQREISSSLSYLANLRTAHAWREDLFAVAPLDPTTNVQLAPRNELRWRPANHELTLGHRWLRTRDRPGGAGATTRVERNLFGRFETRFEDRPQFTLEFDRRDIATDGGRETALSRLRGGLEYRKAGWIASAGRRHDVTDTEGSLRRTLDENQLAVTFVRDFAEGEVTLFASYNLEDLTARDELATPTVVPVPRTIRRGLSALDATPLDGALADDPALVDGNRVAPTSANIGGGLAGGQTGWNLGAELALFEPVDVIDVWLSAPIPAQNAVQFVFEVYRSDDNLSWTRVTPAAGRTYDPFDGRFRLRFPSVVTRYVKVVNATLDDALGPVFVSEIEVFGSELRQGRTETDTRTESSAATLTWAPRSGFAATLSGFATEVRNERGDQLTRTATDTGNLTLSFQPSPVLLGSASAFASRQERTGVEAETERLYSLSLTALPLEDLDLTMAASLRDRERGGLNAESQAVLLGVALLLYRDLSASFDYGIGREESLDAPARNRHSLRASLNARPRQEIELTSALLREEIETPALGPELGDQLVVNWSNRLSLRPSSLLSVVLEATYFELPDDDGWSRVVQLDWLPFAGGALQFSLDFREDVPLTGQQRRIRSARLRWNLNRRMFLDLELARGRQDLGDGVETARDTATAFFQARF